MKLGIVPNIHTDLKAERCSVRKMPKLKSQECDNKMRH